MADQSELIDRSAELSTLDQGLRAALGHAGQTVIVEGPAGIGKTALLDAAAVRASERGMQVLRGRGAEFERELPFGVARQLFERKLAGLPDAERARVLEGAARLAAPICMPWAAGERAEVHPFGAEHGLYWLCANLAETAPTLLLIDDAHWADRPTLRWLAYLCQRIEALPMLLLLTRRKGGDDPPALAGLAGNLSAVVLTPGSLSASGSARLVRRDLDEHAADEFCDSCHRVAAGNPYYLRAIAAAAKANGLPATVDGARALPGLVPGDLRRSLLWRIRQLGVDALALARAVAVLGPDAHVRHVAKLAELDPVVAAGAADALGAAEILAPSRPLEFTHPIARAAVYDDLGSGIKALLHARAARMLTHERVDATRVAAHLLAAEPAAEEWVVDLLAGAAGEAERHGAPETAIPLLRRALAEPPPYPRRTRLLLSLGRLELVAGERAAERDLRTACEQAADAASRARAELELARVIALQGRMVESVEVLEPAIDRLGDADPELRLLMETELAAVGRFEPTTATAAIARLRRLQRAGGADRETPAGRRLLALLAFNAIFEHRRVDEAVAIGNRALADGQLLREETADSPFWGFAVDALIAAGHYDAALRECRAALDEARARGSLTGFVIASVSEGVTRHHQGALREAEMQLVAAQQAGAGALADHFNSHCARTLAEVLTDMGALERAQSVLERSGLDAAPGEGAAGAVNLIARGRLRAQQGRIDEGLRDLESGGRMLEECEGDSPAYTPWRSDLALMGVARWPRRRVEQLVATDLELAIASGAARPIGIAMRARGLLEGGAAGLDMLRRAAELLSSSGAQLEYARALVEFGAALRRANRRAEARDVLRQGLDRAHRCCAQQLRARARQELAALGVRVRRAALSGADALTASELRVTRMAAHSMTNREIAQALFVTKKTVETHLRSAYAKLEVSSREELAEALPAEPVAFNA